MNIFVHMYIIYASLVSQMVKNLPVMQKTQIRSLGWEDSLEEEMATHSSTSCLENPMDGGAWFRLLPMGSQRVGPQRNPCRYAITMAGNIHAIVTDPP